MRLDTITLVAPWARRARKHCYRLPHRANSRHRAPILFMMVVLMLVGAADKAAEDSGVKLRRSDMSSGKELGKWTML